MGNCEESKSLVFFVNGKKVIEESPNPETTLLRYLRDTLRLCGTKLGCNEGGCGSCTVMLSRYNREEKIVNNYAVNACLMPICAIHGMAVTTIEGIGSTNSKLHPVQERIAKAHGSQCGFCTPGIVMSMYALLRNSPTPSMKEVEVTFQGNLCRCTGYRPIIEGYRTFTSEYQNAACGMGEKCCKVNGNGCGKEVDDKLFEASEFVPFDPSQEPIFPPELKLTDKYDREVLNFKNSRGVTWFRPVDLKELLEFKKNHKSNAKIVVGNTEVGVEVKLKHFDYKFLVNPSQISELNEIIITNDGVKVGAAVSLSELNNFLENQIKNQPEDETKIYKSICEMLHWFSGMQVRNVASIGGNIMTGSPISDLIPIFLAANVELEVESVENGRRKVRMDEEFFTGYRRNILHPTEVLISILIPKTAKNQFFLAYKQAKRRDDDIAIVNAAFNIEIIGNIVQNAKISFGGMAATTILATKTSNLMKGKEWNRKLVEIVNQSLIDEIPLSNDAPGGVILYRRSLTLSLFFKAFLNISQKLNLLTDDREKSGIEGFQALTPKATQLFEKVSSTQSPTDPIHRPKIHASAFKQATGEAVYCDDIPRYENELYGGLVLSTRAHAKIISINASEALKQNGIHAFYSAKDLKPEQNTNGPIFPDEEVFRSETVTSEGQVLGIIVGDSQDIAQRAARMVKIEYEDIFPIIVSLEDAIEQKTFFTGYPTTSANGDFDKACSEADKIIEGKIRTGGQEHFYIEMHSVIAVPKDSDELELIAASQQPCEMQRRAALMLKIPQNKIVCRTKRIGGAFGGKETRGGLIVLPVAFAAYKLKRPLRLSLDRDEDMMMTGGRNPFLIEYKAACKNDGKIIGCEFKAFLNAGYSLDYSGYVMDNAYVHITNTYNFGSVKFEHNVLRSNTRSNTAFRGFGCPQSMIAAESLIRDVANALDMNYLDVMRKNMLKTGDVTHYNQLLDDCNILRCFDEVQISANIEKRRDEVEKFNAENRWKKRGISLANTMFGVAFPVVLNQGGALIHIYIDGSVLISHGGVEMGQGLHTKMIQVASKALQIPYDIIHIQETCSDKIPNATSTAASMSSDLYGGAILQACDILSKRLAPYREKLSSWNECIYAAYFDRVCLFATGFFAPSEIGPAFNKVKDYYTHGSAISEVEIDCLTGDHQVIRTDIVMDVGSSLNPAIDIGQIEGAFIQGYGLFVMEELIYSPTGTLYSKGPGMYKIPGFGDIPGEFNVSLLTGAPNPRAVYSSRAIGEPPLFLASSVYFAIKEAISAARKEENLSRDFYLQSPATSARIRMACQDKITVKFIESASNDGNSKPWNVDL